MKPSATRSLMVLVLTSLIRVEAFLAARSRFLICRRWVCPILSKPASRHSGGHEALLNTRGLTFVGAPRRFRSAVLPPDSTSEQRQVGPIRHSGTAFGLP